MTPSSGRAVVSLGRRGTAGAIAVALMLTGCGLAGCGVVKAVKKVTHDVQGNKATIDAFTGKLKNAKATPFEATYVTTGSSPATIVYAVRPPKGLAFSETSSRRSGGNGASSLDIIVNSSGEYSCSPPSAGSGSRWSCQKLARASAAVQNKIFGFYTPGHWIAFLKGFSLAAGFAGDSVTSSTKTVNGFGMQCVDFHASGVRGKSSVCTTAQGILGYVKIASDPTSFKIKAYTTSPPASLFKLPPGAKVTKS